MSFNLSAIILAAGDSSRMGIAKPLLKYKGDFFINHIYKAINSAGINDIFVVLGKDMSKITSVWKEPQAKIVFNDSPHLGQIHSLRLALEKMEKQKNFMIALADQPLILPSTYRKICDFFNENQESVIIPRVLREREENGRIYKRGHPIIVPHIYRNLCFEGPVEKGLHWVTHHKNVSVKDLTVNDRAVILDFDTPEDYNGINDIIS